MKYKENFLIALATNANQSGNIYLDEIGELAREFLFHKWTHRHGDHVGVDYWSEKAITDFNKNRALPKGQRRKPSSFLRHEHVVPRAFLARKFKEIKNPELISPFLNRFCIACILHKDEDKKIPPKLKSNMPENWNFESNNEESWSAVDQWERYKCAFAEAKIKIFRVARTDGLTIEGPPILETP
jgi:hypothetical protein